MASKLVGVVNRTNLKNFGSVLQVYALCKAISKLGYESHVVWQTGNLSRNFDIRPIKLMKSALKVLLYPSLLKTTFQTARYVKDIEIDENKIRKFDKFVAANFTEDLYPANHLRKIAKSDKYYKFICGSDQVWSTTTLYPDPMMYLRFAPKEKRVAYAPSMGRDYIPRYNRRTIKKYINGIPCVSIREDEGQRLIRQLTEREVQVTADPTLLLNNTEWDKLSVEVNMPNTYMLCYFLDKPSEKTKNSISEFARAHDLDIVILGIAEELNYPSNRIHRPIAGPAEFLNLTKKANLVVTDSYHGMLFALNYKRDFWSIKRDYGKYDQSSRQISVLSRIGLLDRYLDYEATLPNLKIDYSDVEPKLNEFIRDSLDFLATSLKS